MRVWQAAASWSACFVLLLVTAAPAASPIGSSPVWLPATGGRVPAGAFVGGSEGGTRIHVCRGLYAEEFRYGKVSGDACAIGWSGREIALARFEVLFDSGDLEWMAPQEAASRLNPASAGVASSAAGWICRVRYRGGVHPGEVAGDQCRVAWRGTEVLRDGHAILVQVGEIPAAAVRIAEIPPAENAAEETAPGDVAGRLVQKRPEIPLRAAREDPVKEPSADREDGEPEVAAEIEGAGPAPAESTGELSVEFEVATEAAKSLDDGPGGGVARVPSLAVGPVVRSVAERPRIPSGASVATLVVQTGHAGMLTFVGFSADETRVVTVAADGSARIWDITTGKEIRRIGQHRDSRRISAALSSDQKTLLTADLKEATLWSMETGEKLGTVEIPLSAFSGLKSYKAKQQREAVINDVAFGRRHVVLALGTPGPLLGMPAGMGAQQDAGVVVWDLSSDQPKTLKTTASTVDISPDGTWVVAADREATVSLWNVPKRKQVENFGLSSKMEGMFAGLGTLKAIATGGETLINKAAYKVRFSPDGQYMVTGHLKGTAVLWGRKGGKKKTFTGHQAAVLDARVSHDTNYVVTGSADGTARLWSTATGKQVKSFSGHKAAVSAVNLSRDNRLLLTGGVDQTAILWDVSSGAKIRRFTRRGWQARTARFRPKSNQLLTTHHGQIRLWDLETGRNSRALAGHDGKILSMDVSPDGTRVVSSGVDRSIQFWNLATGERTHKVEGIVLKKVRRGGEGIARFMGLEKMLGEAHFASEVSWSGQGIRMVRFNADGTTVVSGATDGRAKLWDVASGREVKVSPKREPIMAVAFDPEGERVAIGGGWVSEEDVGSAVGGGTVQVWDLTGEAKDQVERLGAAFARKGKAKSRFQRSVDAIAFSPDGQLIFSGSADGTAALWNPATESRMQTFTGHRGGVSDVAFNTDGTEVATASWDNTTRLWDAGSGAVLRTLEGHQASVTSVRFGPEDRRILTASDDGTVRLWNAETGDEIAQLIAVGDDDYIIATPDNYYLASKGASHGVAFRVGDQIYPFEQFDLRLNRPDIVLERLGVARPELIDAYYRAYLKRLARMGFSEEMLSDDFHLPTVAVRGTDGQASTAEKTISFGVTAGDSLYNLDRLNVYVNDVPVYGSAGVDLRPASSRSVDHDVTLELSNGANKIQVSAHNQRGAESLKETFYVQYTGASVKPSLHVAVIGVSEYSDPAITDLRFAAKDAGDIAQWFGRGGRRFRDVRIHRLLDQQATRENIVTLKDELMASAVDDQVVLFLAGHGFLDSKLDYYFATADMVAADPAARGLSYEQIEDLLDGIPARNKLLLMDTCHAGELDKDDTELVAAVAPVSGAGAGGASRGAASVRRKEKGIGLQNSFALMQGLFVNLSRGSGAVAIAAAGGAEYAWEDDKWGNGAFTYSVLEGLESGKADSNGDGEVRVTELRDYVAAQVSELTQGRQQPTARRENVENDFPVHALVPGGG